MLRTAGCDVFTAPCTMLENFISRAEVDRDEIRNQLETSYADKLEIASEVRASLGDEHISRLFTVEAEFVEFLRDLKESGEFARMQHGEELFKRFDQAGFGDLFYSPDNGEWKLIRKNKLPDLDSRLAQQSALDTYYSLLANGDFQNHQDQMDAQILEGMAAAEASASRRFQ